MHGESVLFVQDNPGDRPRASLLFQPTRILSVRNSSGEVTYQEGRDYIWKPGTKEIVLPPESSISFQRPQDLRRPANSQRYALTHRDGNGEILFGGEHEYHDMQTTVSYEYDPNTWAGPRPSLAEQAVAAHDRKTAEQTTAGDRAVGRQHFHRLQCLRLGESGAVSTSVSGSAGSEFEGRIRCANHAEQLRGWRHGHRLGTGEH